MARGKQNSSAENGLIAIGIVIVLVLILGLIFGALGWAIYVFYKKSKKWQAIGVLVLAFIAMIIFGDFYPYSTYPIINWLGYLSNIASIGIALYYLKINHLNPEQKQLLDDALKNNITDKDLQQKIVSKEISIEEGVNEQQEINAIIKKEAEEKAKKEAEEKAKKEAEEKQLLDNLKDPNSRTYFCYSLLNTESKIFLINPENNDILKSSETNLSALYSEGWKVVDVDKTGKSAQFSSFNTVIRLEK